MEFCRIVVTLTHSGTHLYCPDPAVSSQLNILILGISNCASGRTVLIQKSLSTFLVDFGFDTPVHHMTTIFENLNHPMKQAAQK